MPGGSGSLQQVTESCQMAQEIEKTTSCNSYNGNDLTLNQQTVILTYIVYNRIIYKIFDTRGFI